MNIGEISLKNPATNWGDNYTSTMANICDCVLTVQDFDPFAGEPDVHAMS